MSSDSVESSTVVRLSVFSTVDYLLFPVYVYRYDIAAPYWLLVMCWHLLKLLMLQTVLTCHSRTASEPRAPYLLYIDATSPYVPYDLIPIGAANG